MRKSKEKVRRGPSYTVMFLLVVTVVALAGIVIWQCLKVNSLYKQGQTDLTKIKEAFATLELLAEENPAAGEDAAGVQIELNYPSVLSDEARTEKCKTDREESARSESRLQKRIGEIERVHK